MQKPWVFASDFHAPRHSGQGVALLTRFVRDYKPDILIFGGDIVDFAIFSRFVQINRLAGDKTYTLDEEISSVVKDVLEPIRKAAPKAECHYLEGNHEIRVIKMLALGRSGIESRIRLDKEFECDRLGIKYHPSVNGNALVQIGPVKFLHGERSGQNPAKLTLEDEGGPCCVFGHSHRQSFWRDRKRDGQDSISIGVGCLMDKAHYVDRDKYMRGFGYGWLDEKTNQFYAAHAELSGADNTELYTPYGSYNACRVYDGQRERWEVRAIGSGSGRIRKARG